jgi:18S rRNA (guanine1575-N7)-methyltransferase
MLPPIAKTLHQLQGTRYPFLADVGCGSGLSGSVLTEYGFPWVGVDVSKNMVRLAQVTTGCRGRICLGDVACGLPLRRGCLDGAVSISVLQWLCAAADPEAAINRFMQSLHGAMRPGACAALQVYVEGKAA